MLCTNCKENPQELNRRQCKSCITERQNQLYTERRKVVGSKAWWNQKRKVLKRRAKLKEVPFTLTCKDISELYSSDICPYCEQTLQTPSLDRIDSSKPYERSNCIVVCNLCNIAKSALPTTIIKNIYLAMFGNRKPSEI